MRFNRKARLDTSQVSNRRGSRSSARSGGGGIPLPQVAGGGIGGIVVLVLAVVFLGPDILGSSTSPGAAPGSQGGTSSQGREFDQCELGRSAETDEDCARVAVVNSIQAFWSTALPQQTGVDYVEADTVVFSGGTATACGSATSATGPFYCPPDQTIYLDTTFFDDMLERQLGARGGDFAEAYVIAHEYGHHVENLLGLLDGSRGAGATSEAVRVELMADCLAGAWTKAATSTRNADGQALITDLDDQDVAEALDAAAAVGDDRIQQRSGGTVDPETWTHGSAAQRGEWFRRGLARGTVQACDTFGARLG